MWYCVPAPSTNQDWLALLASRTAPVTGVPVAVVAPELSRRVANVSGWLSLSVRFTLIHQAQSPARSPSEALACHAR